MGPPATSRKETVVLRELMSVSKRIMCGSFLLLVWDFGILFLGGSRRLTPFYPHPTTGCILCNAKSPFAVSVGEFLLHTCKLEKRHFSLVPS